MSELNQQKQNQIFIEVTLPQLRKMCEWFEEDEGKPTDWMSMLISTVAATFDSIYERRMLFREEKSEDEQGGC